MVGDVCPIFTGGIVCEEKKKMRLCVRGVLQKKYIYLFPKHRTTTSWVAASA